MITLELQAFIRQQLGTGIAEDVIKQTLSVKGWSEQDINDAFTAIESSQPQAPQTITPPPVTQTPLQTFTRPVSTSHKGMWMIVVIILLLICAGGAFAAYYFGLFAIYMPNEATTLPPVATTTVSTATTTESAATSTLCSQITDAQLLEMKFSLDILRFWQVGAVFQYPQDSNIFYYIMGDSAGESIEIFDASKDKNYLQDENPNIPAYSKVVYTEKISDENEFRGVGFDGDKFVFLETAKDNSPGPCYSAWLSNKLSYIDVNATTSITRQPYVVPADKIQEEQANSDKCQQSIDAGTGP